MKCPECGQWNRASMPHCTRCGAPLNIDAASRLEWKESLRDEGPGTAYIRVDEFGNADSTPDARDVLAREMQDLKKRKQEGAEKQKELRRNTGTRTPRGSKARSRSGNPPGRSCRRMQREQSGCAGFLRKALPQSRKRKSAIGSGIWMIREASLSPGAMTGYMMIPWPITIMPMLLQSGKKCLPGHGNAGKPCIFSERFSWSRCLRQEDILPGVFLRTGRAMSQQVRRPP